MALSAFIFDLDDTLFHEVDFVRSGFRAVAHETADQLDWNADEMFERMWTDFSSGARGNIFDRVLLERGVQHRDAVGGMVEIYRTHIPSIIPVEDCISTLESLSRAGSLGLMTDGPVVMQRNKFNALKLEGYFNATVFSDKLGVEHRKPDPLPYRIICDSLGIDPENAVYVADNPKKDFFGARNVGMKSIRIRYPEGVYSRLEPTELAYSPDYSIDRLTDLLGFLDRKLRKF